MGALLLLLPRFLWQSLVAGLDVARRAFAPRLDLQPGFVDYRTRLPPGSARNAFELISSLMPGSVASDEHEASIEFHCLDIAQPVAEQLAAEERAYARALMPGRPMSDFLLSAVAFVVLMVALGLVRVARGPGRAERMMAAQLLGSGAIGALLLVGAASGEAQCSTWR